MSELLSVITENAKAKLKTFCFLANPGDPALHPTERKAWLDFICQVVSDKSDVNDGAIFEFFRTKSNFVEAGWGVNKEWSEDAAADLEAQFEIACAAIRHYFDLQS